MPHGIGAGIGAWTHERTSGALVEHEALIHAPPEMTVDARVARQPLEASRQQQELVKAGPGKPLAERDVAAELWASFQGFLDRLERDRGRAG